jgi:hypothetical protein
MLSLRSQTKLTPEVLSYVASEGKLGKRQPDSKEKTNETKLNFQNSHCRIKKGNYFFIKKKRLGSSVCHNS